MAEKQVGVAVLNWGTVDETWGYAENVSVAQEANKENVQNGVGDTKGIIYSDLNEKVSADYTPLAAAGETDPPKLALASLIGSTMAVKTMDSASVTIYIDNAEIKYAKGKLTTWSVSGYTNPNIA